MYDCTHDGEDSFGFIIVLISAQTLNIKRTLNYLWGLKGIILEIRTEVNSKSKNDLPMQAIKFKLPG